MTTSAVPASSKPKTRIARPPMRPTVFPSLADATPVMSSDTISGMIVIRMALTQIVPIGATTSAAFCSVAFPAAASAAPSASARTSAIRTRALSFTPRLHHEVAAIDIERRAGDVAGGLRCGEADEIRNLERGPQSRHRVPGGQPLEQLRRRILARELGVDHAGADGGDGDAHLPELLRRRPRQPQQSGLRRRVMGAA